MVYIVELYRIVTNAPLIIMFNSILLSRITAMLNSEEIKKKDSSVKCLEVLSTSKPDHWKSILDAGNTDCPL